MNYTKPPNRNPGCVIGCHCGMSCCTCKEHCNRPYCRRKTEDEIEIRKDRIHYLQEKLQKYKRELTGLKREQKSER
jgi:hypothetical protein